MRFAGQWGPYAAALAGGTIALPALAARGQGHAVGYAHPESSGVGGTAISSALGTVPGLLMGNIPAAVIGGLTQGIAYGQGHAGGRQAATNYMLGPGVNANTIAWHRMPGT
jgi:hypothetical protein